MCCANSDLGHERRFRDVRDVSGPPPIPEDRGSAASRPRATSGSHGGVRTRSIYRFDSGCAGSVKCVAAWTYYARRATVIHLGRISLEGRPS
jgi:hypothetical protein